MNITYILIAVIIVLIALSAFVLTIVSFLAHSATNKIRLDMNSVISSYNTIIDLKTREIEKLQEKMASLENPDNLLDKNNVSGAKDSSSEEESNSQTETIPISNFLTSSAEYRNNNLADGYAKIKNSFSFTKQDISNSVIKAKTNLFDKEYVAKVKEVLDYLNYDRLYELITLSSDKQYGIFEKKFDSNYKMVFDNYIKEIGSVDKFDAVQFKGWLSSIVFVSTNEAEVRSSDITNQAEYDPSLCDGYQVYVGNKMYDYGISKKDVS